MIKNMPANAGDIRDVGAIPGSGRASGYCVIGHSFRVKQKEDEAKEISRMQSERKKRKKV